MTLLNRMLHVLSSHKTPRLAAALLAAVFSACASSGNQCLPEPATECLPDINVDFSSIHRSVILPSCGTAGNACHGPDGRRGNLVLADADTAYKALLGQDGTNARVTPGDPGCSVLMQRLESDDPVARMPYGDDKLSEGFRCAVRIWIERGAAR
jgi:hypothetical protein